jgi:hypothetical protein
VQGDGEELEKWELHRGDLVLGYMEQAGFLPPQPTIGDPQTAMGFVWFESFTPTTAFEEYRSLFDHLRELLKDDPFWDDEEYWIALTYTNENILPLGLTLVNSNGTHRLKPLFLKLKPDNRLFASYSKEAES